MKQQRDVEDGKAKFLFTIHACIFMELLSIWRILKVFKCAPFFGVWKVAGKRKEFLRAC